MILADSVPVAGDVGWQRSLQQSMLPGGATWHGAVPGAPQLEPKPAASPRRGASSGGLTADPDPARSTWIMACWRPVSTTTSPSGSRTTRTRTAANWAARPVGTGRMNARDCSARRRAADSAVNSANPGQPPPPGAGSGPSRLPLGGPRPPVAAAPRTAPGRAGMSGPPAIMSLISLMRLRSGDALVGAVGFAWQGPGGGLPRCGPRAGTR